MTPLEMFPLVLLSAATAAAGLASSSAACCWRSVSRVRRAAADALGAPAGPLVAAHTHRDGRPLPTVAVRVRGAAGGAEHVPAAGLRGRR